LSIALATQQSKAAKEQLQVARAEQKDLLEDLCDIEDELDTKLGIFRVHINGKGSVCGNVLGLGNLQPQQCEYCCKTLDICHIKPYMVILSHILYIIVT